MLEIALNISHEPLESIQTICLHCQGHTDGHRAPIRLISLSFFTNVSSTSTLTLHFSFQIHGYSLPDSNFSSSLQLFLRVPLCLGLCSNFKNKNTLAHHYRSFMCNWIWLCSWRVYIFMYSVTLYYFLDQGEVVSISQRGTWRSFSPCHGRCKLVWNGYCMYRVLWQGSEIILCWFSSSIAYGSSGFLLSLPGPKILNELLTTASYELSSYHM